MADYFPLIVNTANSTIDELPAGDNLNLANSNIVNAANISANGVKTDNLYYANGQPWDLQQPAGSNNELQFNNDGSFGASANLTYNDTTQLFTVSGNIDAVNVDAGNLLTANFVSGTLTTSSQPNITNVGSLVNLDVSGNAVIGGNLTVNGNVTYVNVETLDIEDPIIQLQTGPNGAAPTSNSGKDVGTALNYYDTQARVAFMGWDVSNVEFGLASRASISGEVVTFTEYGNLRVGNVAGSNLISANYVSGTLTTAAQPNITSVGALTSLVVSGSANSTITVVDSGNVGNIIGLVHLNPVVENYTSLGVNVDGVSVFIANSNTGNTNSAKSYWNFTSGGNLEHILGGAGAVVAKQGVFGTGNITAGNVYANSGTVGAQTLKGEGGNISNIQGANVSGTVSSATTSGTVTTNAQPNITSVGTLSSLSVTGNANVGNIGAATGVFTNVSGNGAQLTAITGANVTGAVAYATTANSVAGANVSGQVANSLVAGTVYTAAQPNITSIGTLTGLTVNGNITLNNTSSLLNANSSSDALRINQIGTGNALVVEDAANPDSTPFVVSSDGNVSIGGTTPTNKLQVVIPDSKALGQGIELNTVGNTGYFRVVSGWSGGFLPSFTGKASNNSGSFGYGMLFNGLSGNASDTANGVLTFSARDNAGTANVGSTQTAFAFRNHVSNMMVIMGSGNVGMGGNTAPAHTVSINGTLNASGNANVGNIGATNGVFTNVSGNGSALTAITGANVIGEVAYAATSNSVAGANVSGQVANALVAGTVYTAAQPNITSLGTLTGLGVNGTITGVNITANTGVFTGNGSGLSAIAGANVTGTVASATNAGTATLANTITVTTQTSGNAYLLFGNAVTGTINETANATFVANTSNGALYATTFIGTLSGSATSAGSATTAGTVTTAAQPNITSVGTLTSLAVSGALTTTNITAGANTTAGTITGNWTLTAGSRWQSTYADLAERYQADSNYEPGTVVVLGGEHEVTVEGTADSHKVAGVVTTNPAYIMNLALEGDNVVEVALIGRVPCKVVGPVNKGDLLTTSSVAGHAHANNNAAPGRIIGKALENFDNETGTIEIMVGRT